MNCHRRADLWLARTRPWWVGLFVGALFFPASNLFAAQTAADTSPAKPLVASEFSPPFADFKRFLSPSRPPIKRVIVGLPPNLPEKNFWMLEASLQPATYYVKEITGIPGPGGPARLIVGASFDYIWVIGYSDQVSLTFKKALLAGTNTPPEIESEKLLDLVNGVLNLGLGNLADIATIKWIDTTHLVASTKPFPASQKFASLGQIAGELVGADLVVRQAAAQKDRHECDADETGLGRSDR